MKSKILLLFLFGFAIFFSLNFVIACISYPTIETQNGNFSVGEYNETKIIEALNYYKTNYNKFNLDDNDLIILTNFIKNGYSVKEQTDEEYQVFLKSAKKKNKGWWCGNYYNAVARKGDWTGYIIGQRERTIFWIPCPKVTLFKNCAAGYSNIVWNDLA